MYNNLAGYGHVVKFVGASSVGGVATIEPDANKLYNMTCWKHVGNNVRVVEFGTKPITVDC